jgi:glycerophosphoryl diester phosphodiesterase
MNIEIKDDDIKKTVDLVVELINKFGNHNQLCISSFDHECFKHLSVHNTNIQFQFLFNKEYTWEQPNDDIFKVCRNGTVNIFYGFITAELVKLAHDNNFGIMAWCNKKINNKVIVEEDEETLFNLMKMGVDVICTNKPDIAISARQRFLELVDDTVQV